MDGLRTAVRPAASLMAQVRAFYLLSKPNLSGLVVITGIIGFHLASRPGEPTDWLRFVHLVIGLALTAAGACALNMVLERDVDRLMRRTRMRPIPAGLLSASAALGFALGTFTAGFCELLLFAGVYPALLSLFTMLTYAFVYTPAKRRGPISILIGAIPGAIPPVMGWSCVRGEIGTGGLVLFALLFFWQFPHFLALAWMYRDDYARGGFRFLPVADSDGRKTGRAIAVGCAVAVAASLLPWAFHLTGLVFLAGALVAGALFLFPCVRVARQPTMAHARTAFIASVTYLPLLLTLLLLDRFIA